MSARRTTVAALVPRPGRWWRVALGVALAVQLITLYSPDVGGGPHIPGLDKMVHLAVFAVPALAALMVGISAPWVLGVLAVHAPVSELIQRFAMPGRSGDLFDVMADLAGVAVGGLAFVVWSRRQP